MKLLKNIILDINSLEGNKLRAYCYGLDDEFCLLVLNTLYYRFLKDKDLKIAELITELCTIKYFAFDGIEYFEISFYEEVLKIFPDNKSFLIGILHFCLPPYTIGMKNYFNFQHYRDRLRKIDPQNPILSLID